MKEKEKERGKVRKGRETRNEGGREGNEGMRDVTEGGGGGGEVARPPPPPPPSLTPYCYIYSRLSVYVCACVCVCLRFSALGGKDRAAGGRGVFFFRLVLDCRGLM